MKGLLPDGYSWRELWDFKNLIKTTIIPSKIRGGHPLTLTNEAAKGTTADGVHFTGAATSNMVTAADAVLNNQAKFWACIRFKFDQTFSSASAADQYLMNKTNAGLYVRLRFESDDGKLYWEGSDGGVNTFSLTSTTVSWTANTWYTIIASLSDVGPAQRLLVDGSAEDTDTAVAFNTPNGGDLIIGSSSDGGADGFEGTISWAVIGTDALTTTADTGEEALLTKGVPPADAVNLYTIDEGRGTTCTCRGSGADDATLDSACTWDFGQAKLNCLSFDGINDYAVSSAGVDISGNISVVWVGKAKSTHATLAANVTFMEIYIDANDSIRFFADTSSNLSYYVEGNNTPKTLTVAGAHSIDDYLILLGTVDVSGNAAFYRNGASVDTDTAVGDRSGAAATAYIGAINTPANYGVSKPTLVGIINGELSAKDALILSRRIDQRYTLGIGV